MIALLSEYPATPLMVPLLASGLILGAVSTIKAVIYKRGGQALFSFGAALIFYMVINTVFFGHSHNSNADLDPHTAGTSIVSTVKQIGKYLLLLITIVMGCVCAYNIATGNNVRIYIIIAIGVLLGVTLFNVVF